MKNELISASNFLTHLVRMSKHNLSEQTLNKFRDCLIEVFRRRFRDHWFPELPNKGSGYRTIRVTTYKIEPMMLQAAEVCFISPNILRQAFNFDLTLWINPTEVYYRIGEHGSLIVIYDKSSTSYWHASNIHLYSTNNKCILI